MNSFSLDLSEYQPEKEFYVGIDSDGCAFDTMELKHKECFGPAIIKYWGLQPVSKYAREAFEFVNLYSRWRGINRWHALVKVMDLLREREEVRRRNFAVPELNSLREFVGSGLPLSNSGLAQYMEGRSNAELNRAMAWTIAVNAAIEEMVHGVAPFPYVHQSLKALNEQADLVVVSATPCADLAREWKEHDIAPYIRLIAGQEMGTKAQILQHSAQPHYASEHILMIGDAPGDLKAARANQALFFPINPGYEEEIVAAFLSERV